MPTTRQLRNARAFERAQAARDASEPRSVYEDGDDPSWDDCVEEAERQYAAEGYTPTYDDVIALATKLYGGPE